MIGLSGGGDLIHAVVGSVRGNRVVPGKGIAEGIAICRIGMGPRRIGKVELTAVPIRFNVIRGAAIPRGTPVPVVIPFCVPWFLIWWVCPQV